MASERFFMCAVCCSALRLQRIHLGESYSQRAKPMLIKEVSRTLEELAAIIARLQYVAAELQKARKQELQRRRKQAPPEGEE